MDGLGVRAAAGGELTAGMPPGRGGIGVEEDEEPGHFFATWHIRGSAVSPSAIYRVRMFAGTIELGHADVVILADAEKATRYDREESVPLVEGRALPIKFRVRQERIEGDPNAPVRDPGARGMARTVESGPRPR